MQKKTEAKYTSWDVHLVCKHVVSVGRGRFGVRLSQASWHLRRRKALVYAFLDGLSFCRHYYYTLPSRGGVPVPAVLENEYQLVCGAA